METITIISGRAAQSESRVISPGVVQGRTYAVIQEGPDYFEVKLRGKPVLVDKCYVDRNEPDDENREEIEDLA